VVGGVPVDIVSHILSIASLGRDEREDVVEES
jgi:hypothetical protein